MKGRTCASWRSSGCNGCRSSPEELAKEFEVARKQGFKVLVLGPVHYWIQDFSLLDAPKE